MDYKGIKCILFDLDGTIYFGSKQLAPRANEVIRYARSKYDYIFFATNNSAVSRQNLYHRLRNLGIELEPDEVVNSTYLISRYLLDKKIKEVWCLGTEDLCSDIFSVGVNPHSDTPEAIVIGYNYDFSFKDIEEALKHYNTDCHIIVANMERVYPRANGLISPGAGAVVSAFLWSVNRSDVTILGKPSTLMIDTIAQKINLKPSEILVVGDSLESDIKMADDYGAKSIWITNGNPKEANCNSVKELQELLELL